MGERCWACGTARGCGRLEIAPWSVGTWALPSGHPLFPGLLSLLVRREEAKASSSVGRAQGSNGSR